MQTFSPIEYMKIDLASNFGLDRENWDTRLEWFEEQKDNLDDLISSADEPAMFYASLQAYRDVCAGKPIGYAIGLDATASGAQILTALINCEKSARLCNVIDTGRREDLYTNIHRFMKERQDHASMITRSEAKDAIMPALYCSTARPKEIFGEGKQLTVFHDVMDEEAPGVWQLTEALKNLWQSGNLSHDWVMPDNFHVHVKVMDNHSENVQFMNTPYTVTTKINRGTDSGLSLGANITHSTDGLGVREVIGRCYYDAQRRYQVTDLCFSARTHTDEKDIPSSPNKIMVQTLMGHYRRTGFMSIRLMDYIDVDTINCLSLDETQALWDLLNSLPEKPFKVISVHDRFNVHPNYGDDLRRQYNRFLHDIARSTLLADIASQITGTEIIVPKFGDIADQILESNYALS